MNPIDELFEALKSRSPTYVCLHPTHNENFGCGNQQCWKYIEGAHEAFSAEARGVSLPRSDFEDLMCANPWDDPGKWSYTVVPGVQYPVTLVIASDHRILQDASGRVLAATPLAFEPRWDDAPAQ